ncbi:MAG: hypothetical protein KA758_17305 [Acidimicrobiales bacterium]|nr:hypothetical protein [Acidimicrobiales bacterium]
MAMLVKNVWVEGRYYGPSYGNSDRLPERYWDKVPDDAWYPCPPGTDETDPPVVEVQRYEVLAHAEALGLDVDRRWSTKRLLAAIAKAEEPTTDAV